MRFCHRGMRSVRLATYAMARVYVFADEAGDFAFRRGPNISKYFILCTVVIPNCDVGESLLRLRREMAWNREPLGDYFHATTDPNAIRTKIFSLIQETDIRVDATILEKSKSQPHIRTSDHVFYKYAWFYHFKHVAAQILKPHDELQITAASIGTKKGRGAFLSGLTDVLNQTTQRNKSVTSFWPAQADPCLQIADYCTWAIQRKWERADTIHYETIKSKIATEYELWRVGITHYY